MKIMIYCQHVLGVGHFFRTLEVARAMEDHDVVLVTGGGHLNIHLPEHIRQHELPGLMMDGRFNGLHPTDKNKSIDEIKNKRRIQLFGLLNEEKPDIFLIELFPFGRKAFRFELEPVLAYLKEQKKWRCKVVCSLRDILVEKEDRHLYERRVIKTLNQWFDAVLIHSDPKVNRLEETFEPVEQIQIPIHYTGFVAPLPVPDIVDKIKHRKKKSDSQLIVASAGGGNVGGMLLETVASSFSLLKNPTTTELWIFTGPYMEPELKKRLFSFSSGHLRVEEFSSDFVSVLAAADLSISMAGYNTCMNILAAGVPALVFPFHQNREQGSRINKLMKFTQMKEIDKADLKPVRFAELIDAALTQARQTTGMTLNLNGAQETLLSLMEV